MVSHIEPLVDLPGQLLGVIQTKDAGCTLAGYHRAHLGTGTAGNHALLAHELDERSDILIGDAGQLHGQTGSESDLAVAVLFRGFAQAAHLCRSEHAVFCDDASGEFLSSPVEQEALSFYTLNILFLKCHIQYPFFIFVFSITMLLYFLRFYW